MQFSTNSLIFATFLTPLLALNLTQCRDSGKSYDNLSEKVNIPSCKKLPCKFRRNFAYNIEIKLKPEKNLEKVINSVYAIIEGVSLPFPGFDQSDACPSIYKSDGKTKAGCPLKAGEDYVYKNNIEILQIYPMINPIVHWAIATPEGYLICFEIPIRIIK